MIPPISGAIGPLGPSEWSISPVGGLGSGAAGTTATGTAAATDGSFGSALTNAISSLEQTQATASSAAQALATGQLSDPTQAVTAVENASLSMDLASQIRNKAVDAAQSIFQTAI